jgi:hypothetical protein
LPRRTAVPIIPLSGRADGHDESRGDGGPEDFMLTPLAELVEQTAGFPIGQQRTFGLGGDSS